jgi:NCS1 family nucleobase:cation symporter-1
MAVALFVVIAIMAVYIFNSYGAGNIAEIAYKGGSWGWPFWLTLTANISLGITVIVNSSDYIRYLDNSSVKKYVASYTLGLIPTVLILGGLGMVVYSMSGIWSPLDLFVKYVPSFFIVIIAMAFIILGQFSTNMFANIMPANIIWGHLFKFPWWFTSIFTGCLSLFVVPWFLTTSGGFYSFMNVYGTLLGPLAGVMITDYMIIRKGKYNMTALYSVGGQYSYHKGINLAGVIALIAGALLAMLKLDLSALIGIAAGGVIYYFVFKLWYMPKFPQAEMKPDYVMDPPEAVIVPEKVK